MSTSTTATNSNFTILRECMSAPIILRAAPSDASSSSGKKRTKHKPVSDSISVGSSDDAEELAEFIDVTNPKPPVPFVFCFFPFELLTKKPVPKHRALHLTPGVAANSEPLLSRGGTAAAKLPPRPAGHAAVVLAGPERVVGHGAATGNPGRVPRRRSSAAAGVEADPRCRMRDLRARRAAHLPPPHPEGGAQEGAEARLASGGHAQLGRVAL